MAEQHSPRLAISHVLEELHQSFGKNISSINSKFMPKLDEIDLNSRIINEAKQQLLSGYCDSTVHRKICEELLDEVFSDFSLAMYFCTAGLIVPSRMSTRRAFELGLAVVYMWDLPHEYWGWRNKDEDLGFSGMVAHLNSIGYQEYLTQLGGPENNSCICKQGEFQAIYRELSNTVHGKIAGLPQLSPERYSSTHVSGFIGGQLDLIARAQRSIIELVYGRFAKLAPKVEEAFPQINRK